jgi:hypothetical protein
LRYFGQPDCDDDHRIFVVMTSTLEQHSLVWVVLRQQLSSVQKITVLAQALDYVWVVKFKLHTLVMLEYCYWWRGGWLLEKLSHCVCGRVLFLIFVIMKRKFKQWWSTITPISTKWTIISVLNKKKTRTYGIGNECHDIWQAQKEA